MPSFGIPKADDATDLTVGFSHTGGTFSVRYPSEIKGSSERRDKPVEYHPSNKVGFIAYGIQENNFYYIHKSSQNVQILLLQHNISREIFE